MSEKQICLAISGISFENNDRNYSLGLGFTLLLLGEDKHFAVLKKNDITLKTADLSDKLCKKIFIIDIVEQGITKSLLARALSISRQTIDNYIEAYKYFGFEGLLGGYNPSKSKDLKEHRTEAQKSGVKGNKAVILAQKRKEKKIEQDRKNPKQLSFDFSETPDVPEEERPYHAEHDWEFTRYAGAFLYLIVLISQHNWLNNIMKTFGRAYKVFMVFLIMTVFNIKSIEQLKNVRLKEAGYILGIKNLNSKKRVWKWFYHAAEMRLADNICMQFFKEQIVNGLVNVQRLFIDGHLLPYSGKEKIHSGYSTQRRMPMPGQTNLVTSDGTGRIICFQIQEGKGNLKQEVLNLKTRWENEFHITPVIVFDREGYGAEFFNNLIEDKVSFVTWEKNVDSKKINAIPEEKFSEHFEFNKKSYSVFEGKKKFVFKRGDHTYEIILRRIYVWNKSSKRKTCCLAWESERSMTTIDCAKSILGRWGASENTFKHLYCRHPFHYIPGFKKVKSENQLIANPELKKVDIQIKSIRKKLNKLYKKVSKSKVIKNIDGSLRKNSLKVRLEEEIEQLERSCARLSEDKKSLPEKIDVSGLEDYRSFKKIDNEGKKLFDFVTASVWNARKAMTDWLLTFYPNKEEYVDLFYAITRCHGWIRTEEKKVIVRLEPLPQPGRRKAQEELCNKLSSLAVRVPSNKFLQLEIGTSPLT